MKPVKNRYVVIEWVGSMWKPCTKKRDNFREHIAEFEELVDVAWLHEPPKYYKSIHVCWLDDIANWDPPFDAPRETITCPPGLDKVLSKHTRAAAFDLTAFGAAEMPNLSPSDQREVRHFKRYLIARQRYGDAVLLKRKFWRKYLGLED